MPTPFEISDAFTEAWADHNPVEASFVGVSGRDHLLGDFSPEGYEACAELYRSTRADLVPGLADPDPVQSFAAEVLIGWLDSKLARHERHTWAREVSHTASTFEGIRDVFDVMPRATPEDWDNIVARLEAFGPALEGYRRSLGVGVERGDVAARRQAESMLEQAEAAAGAGSRFLEFPGQAVNAGADGAAVTRAVDAARAACSDLAQWLRDVYLPSAPDQDAVGRELYAFNVDEFLGMALDPDETYQWGWSEVHRLRSEMVDTAATIDPDLTLAEVIDLLDTDPARSAATREEFVEFVSGIQQQAIAQLDGVHFDVPDELKVVTVNIAPPGGALGAWYHGPTEDMSRPGSIWYAPGERERLPYWGEVSTAYHEGFPGHHLQVGLAVLQRERMSRFHRLRIWTSGSGEGWALYAERLMDELGFFEKPEYRLGLLVSQLMRATRVVVDIGCQLELKIPADAPLHAGEVWGYDAAVDYMEQVALLPRDMAESEVKRYLGWWAQAISYKVGEREILDIRARIRQARGAEFDMKTFHRDLLDLGAIRLDHLHRAMS